MKTIICGGRDGVLDVYDRLWLDGIAKQLPITEVVEGGAMGIDRQARWWAIGRGIPVKTFYAQWNEQGRAAGHLRNAEMAAYAQACIVLPGGVGTANMRRQALAQGLRVIDRTKPLPIPPLPEYVTGDTE